MNRQAVTSSAPGHSCCLSRWGSSYRVGSLGQEGAGGTTHPPVRSAGDPLGRDVPRVLGGVLGVPTDFFDRSSWDGDRNSIQRRSNHNGRCFWDPVGIPVLLGNIKINPTRYGRPPISSARPTLGGKGKEYPPGPVGSLFPWLDFALLGLYRGGVWAPGVGLAIRVRVLHGLGLGH